jgi:hypothetical protein
MVDIMKRIAEHEARRGMMLEIGIVENVKIRKSENDTSNYECSILLPSHPTEEGRPMKIEDVPILTPHIGSVPPLYPDDMVVVGFIHGEISHPIVLGRLYTKEKRSPVHKDNQYLIYFDTESYGNKEEKESGYGTFSISFKGGYRVMIDKGELKGESNDGKTSLTMSQTKVVLKVEGTNITIEKGKGITMETDGEINIKASKEIRIKGSKVHIN